METDSNFPRPDDRELVNRHRAGDGQAFRRIVERYQSMVCALAYSACGDVSRSEDVAQEVFVTAWKKLAELREPEKLRGWLCGIVRNVTRHAVRSDRRTPTARAEELTPEMAAEEAGDPAAQAVSGEAAALMWRALGAMPENYREPMVLYYREHQSVGAVAAALEISEDLVRQRLARGRAMLNERMARFVEETLTRTAPTAAFSAAVFVALPVAVGPGVVLAEAGAAGAKSAPVGKALASAGTIGVAAIKGGLAMKVLAAFAVLPALMGGLTDYRRFRSQFDAEESAEHRGRVLRRYLVPNLAVAFMFTGILSLSQWGGRLQREHGFIFGMLVAGTMLVPLIVIGRKQRQDRRMKVEKIVPAEAAPAFEYVSAYRLFGWPLLHVTTGGGKGAGERRVAKGWIAVSDYRAVGALFGTAPAVVAPISCGGLAVGIFSIGGAVTGMAAIGVVAVGGWAAGFTAVAWRAAWGWLAVAHDFASGGILRAAHADDVAAAAYFHANAFGVLVTTSWRIALWATMFSWLPPLVLMGWHALRARRAAAR